MPLLLRLSDSVLCTGKKVAEAHPGARRLGSRLVLFYPPVDMDSFAPSEDRRQAARRELGLSPNDVVVGTVANINPQKGGLMFARAASRLRKMCAARFVILGTAYPQHEKYARQIWAEASAHGLRLGQDLIVRDPQGRVADLACALDVFWLTSEPRSEGIPTVIGEAMALGIPVLSTDVGAVSEAIVDKVTGFIVPPGDYIRLANLTHDLLSNPAVKRAMQRNARDASERFDVELCARAHIEAFKVAQAHSRSRPSGNSETRDGWD